MCINPDKMKIITAAQLDGYRRLKDKSVSLRFITCELSTEKIMVVDQLLDNFGYLYFKPENKLTDQEVKELDNLDTDLYDNPKTQSKRIRNVLYKNWEQNSCGHADFKDYYKHETERIINHYKKKLD